MQKPKYTVNNPLLAILFPWNHHSSTSYFLMTFKQHDHEKAHIRWVLRALSLGPSSRLLVLAWHCSWVRKNCIKVQIVCQSQPIEVHLCAGEEDPFSHVFSGFQIVSLHISTNWSSKGEQPPWKWLTLMLNQILGDPFSESNFKVRHYHLTFVIFQSQSERC